MIIMILIKKKMKKCLEIADKIDILWIFNIHIPIILSIFSLSIFS